ncbi:MAG: HAD family phosphatase [Candidatus Kapabacteria bacterium]|nr:HAD family phosphatase [Candidatus Kapabacteria bacterium]
MNSITTILFDLGGVLYDINMKRTQDSLSLLAGSEIDYSIASQHDVFSLFESGKITAQEFRDGLRTAYNITATDDELDAAWNALLVGVIPNRIEMLQRVKTKFRIALLSNINVIHHNRIDDEVKELFAQFDTLFLSYDVGMRKPNEDIYRHALAELQATPQEVLFIDDSPLNIYTAQKLGIHAYHVTQTFTVEGIVERMMTLA